MLARCLTVSVSQMVVALRKAALPVAALIIVAAACTSTALGYSPGMGQRITGSALAGLALALGGLYKRALDVSGVPSHLLPGHTLRAATVVPCIRVRTCPSTCTHVRALCTDGQAGPWWPLAAAPLR